MALNLRKSPAFKIVIVGLLLSVIVAVIWATPIRFSMVQGNSMLPTLKDGQILLCTTDTKKIFKEDIIILSPSWANGKDLVKRVVGEPGDEVTRYASGIYINGTKYTSGTENPHTWFKYKLKKGEYLVKGDNYPRSNDSISRLKSNYSIENSIVNKKDIELKVLGVD